ncbi:MAG: phosphate transport system regulatory protein PhoU [Proteobacteria bacterium]|jgi:phosphate transport system protein|nr:phosphate transport system regulatory protein PhoU [Pseudomonadota bacterium]
MSLKEHTVKSYDNDLKSIAGTLDLTVSLIFQSLDMISSAINQHNQQLVEDITNHDYKINTLDHLIEKKVTTILALRQPMAVDLRYIISSLKVSANLERIGDQAKNIIKKISLLDDYNFDSKVQEWLTQMISISKNMIQNAVLAFNSQNLDLAKQVMTQDDIIDQTYRNFFSLLNKENFSRNEVNQIINTLFIAKSFERLADHSTNIAEITGFVITGERK